MQKDLSSQAILEIPYSNVPEFLTAPKGPLFPGAVSKKA